MVTASETLKAETLEQAARGMAGIQAPSAHLEFKDADQVATPHDNSSETSRANRAPNRRGTFVDRWAAGRLQKNER